MKVNLNHLPDETAPEEPKETTTQTETELKGTPKSFFQSVKDGSLFRQNKFWIVLCVILFVIFISTNSRFSNEKLRLNVLINKATNETADLVSATEEIKAELEEQARIESLQLSEEAEELARNNAIEQGVLVAKYQNEYGDIELPEAPPENAGSEEKDLYQKEMTRYAQTIRDHAKKFDPYFGENDKNARTPWYNYKEPLGLSGTWEFASKASFKGNYAPVLWLCYADEDHSLLAYCSAVYHADTKQFTDVQCLVTKYAKSHMTTDDVEAVEGDSVTSIADQLKDVADELETEMLDQETTEGLSDTRDSYKEDVASGNVEGEEYDENYNVGLPSEGENISN